MVLSNPTGVLYVVATPIGHLGDISERARQVLAEVDVVVAEDTRHSGQLLARLGIRRPMMSLHEHNEDRQKALVLARLAEGESIALVSDAGTPLISDPGFPLVRSAREQGFQVVPIPGPSAVITALSAAGLPTDRFLFLGFPPRMASARRTFLESVVRESATLVFYESGHRILGSLADLEQVFGSERRAVLARELTKMHETFLDAPISQLRKLVEADPDQRRGEMVLMVAGAQMADKEMATGFQVAQLLKVLLRYHPRKQAVVMAAEITGLRRNELYQQSLSLDDLC